MRDRTKAYLAAASDLISSAIGADALAQDISYSQLSSSATADTLLAQAGSATAVVKLFGNEDNARTAFDRERNALHLFGGEICAKLLGQDEDNGLVIMSAIDGQMLDGD